MSTIDVPITGCVDLADLRGPLTWVVTGPDRFRAGAWQDDAPGCAPTTAHQRALLIDGGTASLRDLYPGERLAIGFDYPAMDPCGRFQIDIVNAVSREMAALVIDAGVACHRAIVVPPVHPPIHTPPQAAVVPEPSTLLLTGALLARALWQRWEGR